MGKYVFVDNCYPKTTELVNKHDIRDEALLNEIEAMVVSAKPTCLFEVSFNEFYSMVR